MSVGQGSAGRKVLSKEHGSGRTHVRGRSVFASGISWRVSSGERALRCVHPRAMSTCTGGGVRPPGYRPSHIFGRSVGIYILRACNTGGPFFL